MLENAEFDESSRKVTKVITFTLESLWDFLFGRPEAKEGKQVD